MIVECHTNLSLSKLKLNTLKLSLMSCHEVFIHSVDSCINLRKWFYYRPQTKLWEGNVFRRVCQSFCSRGGLGMSCSGSRGSYGSGVCLWVQGVYTPWSHTLVNTSWLHPQKHTPPDTPHHTHLGHTHPQQAGGMHPTGMLSYLVCYFTVKFVNSFVFYCPNCDFCYVNITNED